MQRGERTSCLDAEAGVTIEYVCPLRDGGDQSHYPSDDWEHYISFLISSYQGLKEENTRNRLHFVSHLSRSDNHHYVAWTFKMSCSLYEICSISNNTHHLKHSSY